MTDIAELKRTIARLRRLMPYDRDVRLVCDALRGVIDLQPEEKKAKRFKKAHYDAYRREYRRQWMANYRKKKQESQII